jgi:hypothetical protein
MKLIYETDFSKWVKDQAKFLKKGEFEKLDMDNLIEEIESLGRSEKRTLESYLENLLMHKLKVKFQKLEIDSVSWALSIKEASYKAQKTLSENPSLKSKIKKIIEDAYFSARLKAAKETKLDIATFPEKCPWALTEIFPGLKKKSCLCLDILF